jgi:multimeric flavodoxin WrbA
MKAIILNGSLNDNGVLEKIHELIWDELQSKNWDVEVCILRHMKITHCIGCFGCWVETPGTCLFKDGGIEVAKKVIKSDLAIFLTPITFGGYSSELKKAVDRLICLISPFFMRIEGEVHHKPRYERYPNLIGIGLHTNKDEESERIFSTLVKRNAINLHAPFHRSQIFLDNQPVENLRQEIHSLFNAIPSRQ